MLHTKNFMISNLKFLLHISFHIMARKKALKLLDKMNTQIPLLIKLYCKMLNRPKLLVFTPNLAGSGQGLEISASTDLYPRTNKYLAFINQNSILCVLYVGYRIYELFIFISITVPFKNNFGV